MPSKDTIGQVYNNLDFTPAFELFVTGAPFNPDTRKQSEQRYRGRAQ